MRNVRNTIVRVVSITCIIRIVGTFGMQSVTRLGVDRRYRLITSARDLLYKPRDWSLRVSVARYLSFRISFTFVKSFSYETQYITRPRIRSDIYPDSWHFPPRSDESSRNCTEQTELKHSHARSRRDASRAEKKIVHTKGSHTVDGRTRSHPWKCHAYKKREREKERMIEVSLYSPRKVDSDSLAKGCRPCHFIINAMYIDFVCLPP